MFLKHLSANAPLKILSVIIAYGLWSFINQMHPTLLTVTVPLCFYNEKKATILKAPDSLKITLSGRRSDLARIELASLAAHVDASSLLPGPNNLTLTREHLFVPPSCNLVHYTPSNILISVQEEITTV